MGIFFSSGESKKRPGVYQRYQNAGSPPVAGAANGVVAAVVRSSWGPLGKAVTVSSYDEAVAVFGSGGEAGTVSILQEIFAGGASEIHVVRLGGEGTKGTVSLKDTGDTPQDVVKVTAKHAGNRAFRYLVRQSLGDENTKEFVVYENGVVLEKLSFAAGGANEPANLIAAGKASSYFDFDAVSGAVGTAVAIVPETEFPAGTNPTITNADYSNSFALLEAYPFNVLTLDTTTAAVQQLAANFVRRVYEYGKLCFLVIGEPVSVPYSDRCAHAKANNDYRIVYVGSGYVDSLGGTVDGVPAIARVVGMVAAVPSNQSVTHAVLSGATDTAEKLTNSQYEQAIDSGMIVFSLSSAGSVWIDAGITTLVTPTGEDDEGWKKIKRVKVRWELMDRVSATTEPLIGRVNNNPDGRSTVMQAVQGVLNTMEAEEKISVGATVELDSANPPAGDSAWFIIQADDIDSLEKMYFVYNFRYSSAS